MSAQSLRKAGLRPLYAPFRLVRFLLQRRSQRRCLLANQPIPFRYWGETLYMAPDDYAMRHIGESTGKLARLAEWVPSSSKVVLDVGAHSGLFSHFVQKRCPAARIVAFEPNTDLRETFLLNQMNGTELVTTAVGDHSGSVPLFVNTRCTQTSSAIHKAAAVFAAPETMQTREVPLITLDEYCAEHGSSEVDALKIDVQGFEPHVIKGAQSMLATVKVLLLEATFLDLEGVQLLLDLRKHFEHAYAVNDVYLGGDVALTRDAFTGAAPYIVQMW